MILRDFKKVSNVFPNKHLLCAAGSLPQPSCFGCEDRAVVAAGAMHAISIKT
jgi:hypothetical protein